MGLSEKMRDGKRLQHLLEQKASAEASLCGSYLIESTCDVEFLCMRIPDDAEGGGSIITGDLGGVLNEQASDASAADFRLDKQGIELGFSIGTGFHGSEPNHCAVQLCKENAASGELLGGHFDRVGVGKESVAIAWVGERCAALQGFELLFFRWNSRANQNLVHR